MEKRLEEEFYFQPALEMAKSLLGKYIVRKINKKKQIAGKIIETEAYIGPQDKAAHSYKGKITPRNQVEYLKGGHIYIYLVYGMYWQFNIVAGKEKEPECVLIRAIEPEKKEDIYQTNGPGKVCRYLGLDKSFYGENLVRSQKIWLENRGEIIQESKIKATKRIGIEYAGPYWANRKWRFFIDGYQKYLPKT